MSNTSNKLSLRRRRKMGLRKRLTGSAARPRLTIFRSNKHIYAQIVDDDTGKTLASASTMNADVKSKAEGNKKDAAKVVGEVVAQRAKAAGVSQVAFDRNGFKYHGRVAALADGAREAGLDF